MDVQELINELEKYKGYEVKSFPSSQFEPKFKLTQYPINEVKCEDNAVSSVFTGKYKTVLEIRV